MYHDGIDYFCFRDNVEWDDAQEELAKQKVTDNSSVIASDKDQEKYED